SGNAPMVFHAAAGGVLRKEGGYTLRFTQPQGWVELGVEYSFGVSRYAMASDPVRNRVFLQSGTGSVGGGSSQGVGNTWQWGGGGTWQEVSTGPPNLYWHAMVF